MDQCYKWCYRNVTSRLVCLGARQKTEDWGRNIETEAWPSNHKAEASSSEGIKTTGEWEQDYAVLAFCEADTQAFYHARCIGKLQPDAIIVHDFEDTDVWMVSSFLSHLSLQQNVMYNNQADQ